MFAIAQNAKVLTELENNMCSFVHAQVFSHPSRAMDNCWIIIILSNQTRTECAASARVMELKRCPMDWANAESVRGE